MRKSQLSAILTKKAFEINPFPNKPWFLHVCNTSLLKTLGKGEIARNEQFLLFPQCFLLFRRTFWHFIKFEIVVCKLFQFGSVYNLSSGYGLRGAEPHSSVCSIQDLRIGVAGSIPRLSQYSF